MLRQGMLAAAKDFVLGAVRGTPTAPAAPAAAVLQSYEISPYRCRARLLCDRSHDGFVAFTSSSGQNCMTGVWAQAGVAAGMQYSMAAAMQHDLAQIITS